MSDERFEKEAEELAAYVALLEAKLSEVEGERDKLRSMIAWDAPTPDHAEWLTKLRKESERAEKAEAALSEAQRRGEALAKAAQELVDLDAADGLYHVDLNRALRLYRTGSPSTVTELDAAAAPEPTSVDGPVLCRRCQRLCDCPEPTVPPARCNAKDDHRGSFSSHTRCELQSGHSEPHRGCSGGMNFHHWRGAAEHPEGGNES